MRLTITAIHVVKDGKTMCGMLSSELKSTERWVGRDEVGHGSATCPGCKAKMGIRKLRLAGKPIPKKSK